MIAATKEPRTLTSSGLRANGTHTTTIPSPVPVRHPNRVCRICGHPFTARVHRGLCGDPDCQRARSNQRAREYYWRKRHGQEPPPRSSYPQHCVICGKRLDQAYGPPIKVCSPKCEQARRTERWAAYYWRNREQVLARQRARARRVREEAKA
jgi:predicted nucleic acid-binding Zn ribbon protein